MDLNLKRLRHSDECYQPKSSVPFLVNPRSPTPKFHELEVQSHIMVDSSRAAEDDDQKIGKSRLSFCFTTMHLLIGGVSPTILNLPATFHQIGYLVGCVGSVVVAILYAYCMHVLVSCEIILCKRLNKPSMSYWQVLHHSFAVGPAPTKCLAKYAKFVTYTVFAFIWWGGNATYVLLIGENIKAVWLYAAAAATAAEAEALDSRTVILCLSAPLVLLSWIPNLKIMAVCSLLSNVLNAASIFVILYVASQNFPFFGNRTAVGDLTKLPYFLGVILITVNGTGLVLSLKNEMKYPHRFGAKFGVLNVAYVPTGILYAVFGLVCYGKFGPATKDTVILNLPRNAFSCLVQGLYAFTITLFYPLVTYVTYEIMWNEFLRYRGKEGRIFWAKYAIKTANALVSVALAYCLPNISIFVSLIGNVCVALDSVILPAIMEMLIHWGGSCFWLRAKISLMIAVGSMLIVVGFENLYAEFLEYYSR